MFKLFSTIYQLCLLSTIFFSTALTLAQVESGGVIEFGTIISGQINNSQPAFSYSFEGQRGEVIAFHLSTTQGNLDPVFRIVNSQGDILVTRDDTNGSKDIQQTFTVQQNDTYSIIIGRFGYSVGSTQGAFELTVERKGILSTPGSRLRYGDSIINRITDNEPQIYYTFQAERGDIISVEMIRNSGSLDPYLQIINDISFLVAENDDSGISNNTNAQIEGLFIEKTGVYIIVATRYRQAEGDSAGSFVLRLNESETSGIGNSVLAPQSIAYNQTLEDNLTSQNYEKFFSFQAQRDDIITVTLDQIGGQFDAYLIIANEDFQTIREDDDSGSGRNARIDRYRIPADGIYYIVATHFTEDEDRSVEGRFRLQLTVNGNAFANVNVDFIRINYGTTVSGYIDDQTPDHLYGFWGNAGDTIRIEMRRVDNDLDTVLELFDRNQNRILSNDDGGNGQNSLIDQYTLPSTGVYFIRATRYSGARGNANTQGNYTLTLAQRFN